MDIFSFCCVEDQIQDFVYTGQVHYLWPTLLAPKKIFTMRSPFNLCKVTIRVISFEMCPLTSLRKQNLLYTQLVRMSDQNIYFNGMLNLPTLIKHILCLVSMLKKLLL